MIDSVKNKWFAKFLLIIILNPLLIAKISLKEVLRIGSDKLNYEFFMITGVDVDKDNNIYIADSKGRFIRKYSKEGKFLKEAGKTGRGPGDFMGPLDVTIGNDKVFVLDSGNRRIAIYDKDLQKKPQYIKITRELGYPTTIFFMKNLLYLTLMLNLNPDKNNTKIIAITPESRFKKVYAFFNHFPEFYKKSKNELQMAVYMGYTFLKTAFNRNKEEIVSCFMHPARRLILYYYNYQGKFIKKQSFELLKGYKFPEFLLKYPKKYPKKYITIMIDSIHYYKNKYILVDYIISRIKRSENNKNLSEDYAYIAIIDTESGKMIGKDRIPSGMRIFRIKGNYMYAKDFDDDIEMLHVYKIEGIN